MAIYCEPTTHLGRQWVKLDPSDDVPIEALKKRLPAGHWNTAHQAWLIPWRENWLERLREKFGDLAEVIEGVPPVRRARAPRAAGRSEGHLTGRASSRSSALPPEYQALLEQREYSPATIRVYVSHFNMLLTYAGHRAPQDISAEDIRGYLLHMRDGRKVSYGYLNQAVSAIKFYYEQVLVPSRLVPALPPTETPDQEARNANGDEENVTAGNTDL